MPQSRYGQIKQGKIANIVEQDEVPTVSGTWVLLPDGRERIGDAWPWAAPIVPVVYVIDAQDFWDRFTFAERTQLEIAEQHNPADTNAKQKAAAQRRLRRRDIDRNGTVNLQKNWTVSYVTDMETDGIIAAGRAAVLLAPA